MRQTGAAVVQITAGESKICYNSGELFRDQSNLIRAKILFLSKLGSMRGLVSFV